MSRRAALVVLAVMLVAGGAWRGYWAADGGEKQSADERSYGALAISLWRDHDYGSPQTQDLHWPPGAPFFFAPAVAFNSEADDAARDVPAARWLQFAAGVALIGAVWWLGLLLAGPPAAAAAAAVIALYAPLARNTAELLSEPLGALLLCLAVIALAQAIRGPGSPRAYALAGGAFALTVLTRTDLLPAPFLLAVLVAGLTWHRAGPRPAALRGGALALGTIAVLAPWTIYATSRADKFVPVTEGDGAALFVGSFLPGDGTRTGMKRALEAEVRRRYTDLPADLPAAKIDARLVLGAVAARNPGLPRNESLREEAKDNVRDYLIGDPLSFAAMAARKTGRMWLKSTRAGSSVANPVTRTWHFVLVIASALALVAGVARLRDPVLASILVILLASTALHAVFVANPRYALPLMPILVAGGCAAAVRLWAERRGAPGSSH